MVKLKAQGRMRDPKAVQDILERTKDESISFTLDGGFTLAVTSKLGTSPAEQVITRLETLGTLCELAKTLRQHSFACKEISFAKVCFTYAPGQDITLHFSPASPSPSSSSGSGESRITLEVPPSSPIRRVRKLMEEILNDPSAGFSRFTMALEFFLPVLRGFDSLESRHRLDAPLSPIILPRQVDYYRLTYPNPEPGGGGKPFAAFDLHFKRNKDELEWRVSDVLPNAVKEERESIFPGFKESLGAFMRKVGTGWTGMRTLLVANQNGIEEAILELDKVVWDAMVEGRKRRAEMGEGVGEGEGMKQEVITID